MHYRVGIDIGGTFTDFTVLGDDGSVFLWKEDTDPKAPVNAIRTGIDAVAANLGQTTEAFLRKVKLVVHGTTIATNTLIQRNGPTVGLLCTEGFRDILYLRDAFKPERFNVHLPHPKPFVDRHLRLPLRERIDRAGRIKVPLEEAQVRAAAAVFRSHEVGAVAVALLWSVVNDSHEKRVAEILAEELPGVPVLCSANILPEIREWERTSACALSAYMLPGIRDYLGEFETLLRESGYGRGPLIMQINGGCSSVPEIFRRPVNILASGPAAAPAAAAYYVRGADLRNVITIDMGGTSLDACLIRDGRAGISRDIQVEHQPIGVPGVEVLSVGAGGGSIAWIDNGGALRVGPRSAGARPGPAAYGMGGTEPTVTDANVVLRYLDPASFLGGRRTLRADFAEKAVSEKVAERLGLDRLAAAAGIVRIVNANMVAAIRAISVQRGIDVRDFTLVAGGGAGGLHAVALARELRMKKVLIPREAGTLCAFGMAVTDVRNDEVVAHHTLSTAPDFAAVDALFARLEANAVAKLRDEGFADEDIALERSVDARYPGQVHELTVPVPTAKRLGADDIAEVAKGFHDHHRQQFTFARTDFPIEFLHWRLTAIGKAEKATVVPPQKMDAGDVQQARIGRRDAYLPEAQALRPHDIYDADALGFGTVVEGPAIVQAKTTTILVGDGDSMTVDRDLGFIISIALPAEKRAAA